MNTANELDRSIATVFTAALTRMVAVVRTAQGKGYFLCEAGSFTYEFVSDEAPDRLVGTYQLKDGVPKQSLLEFITNDLRELADGLRNQ